MVFAATEVGTPEGEKVTKDIGPAGGTLASPDGRLTLTVPPNALTDTIAFSIQPITNQSRGGIGLAYRLEPAGKTFTTPLEISVRYDENDLEGTIPEVLSLAYQDEKGAWHETKTMNQTADTITVAATHFSDWSFLTKMRLEPEKATVRVGERLSIVLLGCAQPELTWFQRLFIVRGRTYTDPDMHCNFGTMDKVPYEWLVDIGTIENGTNPVWFTAPSRKPTPNIATVVFPYSAVDQHAWKKEDSSRRGMFLAHITIIDARYRATGRSGDVEYSGVICDLEKPFEIIGSSSLVKYPFKFAPISGTGGKVSFSARVSVINMEGGGFYTIEGVDTDNPRIAMTLQSSGQTPIGSRSGGGTVYIKLVPLDTDECN